MAKTADADFDAWHAARPESGDSVVVEFSNSDFTEVAQGVCLDTTSKCTLIQFENETLYINEHGWVYEAVLDDEDAPNAANSRAKGAPRNYTAQIARIIDE